MTPMPRPPGRGLTRTQAQRLRSAQERAVSASRQLSAVIEALTEGGVRVEAIADFLGVSRQAVYARLKRHQDG